ncbi:MAG: B12-binding domain-containing radical SAM protein [Deltaproteobacteria bacterium]|nr:B12-binding domain-containing radical SAM protein [Deltaproteobacteria bacterium]
MKRVLFINPDWTGIHRQSQRQFKRVWPPISLALAAAMVREAGHSARILDNNAQGLPLSRVRDMAARFDQVFVTSTPYDRWQCPALDISFFLDTCKAADPARLYILGSHPTERPAELLAETGARAAILSEPEQTILALVEQDDPAAGGPPPKIPGTARLDRDGSLHTAPPRPFLEDMDSLPFPALDLLPLRAYHYFPLMGKRFGILEASRGCPFGCSFCYLGMYGRKVRRKSPGRFADEVADAVARHRLDNLYFMDLEFALDPGWVNAFCGEIISRGLAFSWACQTRVADLSPALARTMKRAGCTLVHLGVEAGSARILSAIGKGIAPDQARAAVAAAREAGMRTVVFFNLGYPGETEEEMDETVDLALSLSPTWASFHLFVPFPGTKLAAETGVDCHALPAHLYPQYVDSHDLKKLKRRLSAAYARFYLRPRFAWNLALDARRAGRRADHA